MTLSPLAVIFSWVAAASGEVWAVGMDEEGAVLADPSIGLDEEEADEGVGGLKAFLTFCRASRSSHEADAEDCRFDETCILCATGMALAPYMSC